MVAIYSKSSFNFASVAVPSFTDYSLIFEIRSSALK